jgi:glycogen phosphorylase
VGRFVQALAYDVPIPGYGTDNTLGIRLWAAKPKKQFDLYDFNAGRYRESVSEKQAAENITQVR